MKKNILLSLLFLSLMLLLISCSQSGTKTLEKTNLLEKVDICKDKSGSNRELCYRSLASETKDKTVCLNLQDKQAFESCLETVAHRTHNIEICNEIVTQDIKNICIYTIAFEDKTGEYVKSSDCNKIIGDDTSKSKCLAYAERDESNCDTISNLKEKDSCYGDLAYRKSDAQICNKIQDLKYKDGCLSRHATLVAKDPNLCNTISSQNYKDDCYYLIGLEKLDISLCNKIVENNKWKVMCVAVVNNDPKLCSDLGVAQKSCESLVKEKRGNQK